LILKYIFGLIGLNWVVAPLSLLALWLIQNSIAGRRFRIYLFFA